MGELHWIKLNIDFMNNRKIKKIRRLPDGNNIILFWVFLLTKAGESNQDGALFFLEDIPYTIEDLADEFDFSYDFVQFALATLEKLKMIGIYENVIYIRNWEKYQNVDGMERIREQTRKRVAKYREKKQLEESNVTSNVTVTQGNATEKELDKELDKEKDKRKTPKKNTFDENHMKLAELLYSKIKENNPKAKEPNYKSWANTFRLMMERDKREGREIQQLILWTQQHEFWHQNVLSANNLRKNYDRLLLQMQNESEQEGGKQREISRTSYRQESKYDFSKRRSL